MPEENANARAMAPRAKVTTKDPTPSIVNVSLSAGDWIDVMDAEGTWNVAHVLSIPTPKTVRVRYDGWGREYDEEVPLNSDRVAPYHTYTWSVKCWAKYKNWPWWPSIVTIRPPGTLGGLQYLEQETRLFVDFLDGKDFSKRCRCWVERSNVRPFGERCDERRKRSTGMDFENAFALVLKSTAIEKFPSFASGTLPVQFKTTIATPVKTMRKETGMNQWAGSINTGRSRHCRVYMYKSADLDDDDDDDDGPNVQFIPDSDDDDTSPKKSRTKGKGKAPARSISGKTSPASKTVASKSAARYSDVVVKMEDSAQIVDGPHALSPKREPEEQPLYLPPIEDHADSSFAPAFDVQTETVLSGETTQTSTTASPETTSQDLSEPSVGTKTRSEMSSDEVAVEVRREGTDVAIQVIPPTINGSPKSALTTSPPGANKDTSPTPHDTSATPPLAMSSDTLPDESGDRSLIEDIVENDDDDDDESDIIPLDAVDDLDVMPTRDEQDGQSALATASPAMSELSKTTAEKDSVVHNPLDGITDNVMSDVQIDGALSRLQQISNAVETSLSSTSTSREDEPPAKSAPSKRKAPKSLADECISQAQAALADPNDIPVSKKKKRQDSVTRKATSTIRTPQPSTALSKVPDTSSSKPTDAQPQAAQRENSPDQGILESRRRSRMRAGSKYDGEPGQRKSQGITSVWVLPPPKFDSTARGDTAPWVVSAQPALPTPFSSLALFGSTVDFSMRKWFKQDKYPHYLAQ